LYFVYNSSFHTALKETPFKLVYGRDPPAFHSYDNGEIRVAVVAQSMAERDEFTEDVRLRLEQAQQYAKLQYDKYHRELVLKVGDWVWVKLRHRPIASVADQPRGKLAPCFFGPYKIVDKINEVAYKLDLPSGARIHNVFHVGLLKKFVGLPPDEPPALPPMKHGVVIPTPEQALTVRLCWGVRQILVRWKGQPASSTSWEDVMWGRKYERRLRKEKK
jgi:hypothetical protein